MASTSTSIAAVPHGRLLTAADLAAMPTHLPSGDVDFELDKGRLILMVPPGHLHGGVQANFAIILGVRGQHAGHGRVFTDVGLVLSRRPDTVVGPDVAFITTAKLPVRESPEGYLETIPDLVIEIRSRNDTSAEVESKVAAYLAAGVRVVWVADPVERTIVVHRSGTKPNVYKESDSITMDEVIPGFRLKVAEAFSS
jgi:Uma2 family endonuclease